MSLSFDDRANAQGIAADFRRSMQQDCAAPFAPPSDDDDRDLRDILPICRSAGITRLGDLTGLDRLGLPVVQAVRPEALSDVTSLGRGKTLRQAAIGALMKSMERAYAEAIPPARVFVATADALDLPPDVFDALTLPHRRQDWRSIETAWVLGLDVVDDVAMPVPLELVHTCYTEPPLPYDGLFYRTTTGLACHSTTIDAFRHGLFECLERDAMARAFATHGFFERMRLSPEQLGDDVGKQLAAAAGCGIKAAFWAPPSPAGIPVVWCQTIETGEEAPLLGLPTEGYAAAPTFEQAASAALLEALVTRAAVISGVRDDLTAAHYRQNQREIIDKARRLILEPATALRDTPKAPDLRSVRDIVDCVASRLGPVIAVPVGADRGIHCVRAVLAAGLPFATVR